MKYTITIREITERDFEVEADNLSDAINTAKEKYNSGEFVLEPGDLVSKYVDYNYDNEKCWDEF